MVNRETTSLIVAVAGAALVSFSSIPAICNVVKRLSLWSKRSRVSIHDNVNHNGSNQNRSRSNESDDYQLLQGLYQDDDGQATEESMNDFSDRVHHIFIILLSATGFLFSLALGIIFTKASSVRLSSSSLLLINQWLQFGIWVCLLFSFQNFTSWIVDRFRVHHYYWHE